MARVGERTSSNLSAARAIVCANGSALSPHPRQRPGGAAPGEFTTQGSEVLDFAVILLLETEGAMEKEPGEVFHSGTLGEGMRAAISEVERGYREMIEGWKSR